MEARLAFRGSPSRDLRASRKPRPRQRHSAEGRGFLQGSRLLLPRGPPRAVVARSNALARAPGVRAFWPSLVPLLLLTEMHCTHGNKQKLSSNSQPRLARLLLLEEQRRCDNQSPRAQHHRPKKNVWKRPRRELVEIRPRRPRHGGITPPPCPRAGLTQAGLLEQAITGP